MDHQNRRGGEVRDRGGGAWQVREEVAEDEGRRSHQAVEVSDSISLISGFEFQS